VLAHPGFVEADFIREDELINVPIVTIGDFPV
jgi:hypothetical protein